MHEKIMQSGMITRAVKMTDPHDRLSSLLISRNNFEHLSDPKFTYSPNHRDIFISSYPFPFTMQLVFLGTGGAWPTRNRNVSSTAVILGDKVILVDCGEGTQRQIHWANFSFMKITDILITHFHTDHFLGLFGLMESMYLNNRERPLTIIGPRGLCSLIESLRNIGIIKNAFPLEVMDVEGGDEIDLGGVAIKAFENTHGPRSLGFTVTEDMRPGKFYREKALELGIPEGPLFGRLQRGGEIEIDGEKIKPNMVMGPPRPGRKVVFSGDTHVCPSLVEMAANADVLVHEATYGEDNRKKADEYRHSTAKIAAEAARDAGVKNLVLTHISPRYDDTEVLVREAEEVFENVIAAHDLMEIRVPYAESGNELVVIGPGPIFGETGDGYPGPD